MDRTFKGAAKRLDDIDLPILGARLGVGEDEIHAFIDVETRGSGFDAEGRPQLLRERHHFYRLLSGAERSEAVRQGLANSVAGDYPRESYTWLAKAMKINETAALQSCSWGLGQVMGFNHLDAGYVTVQAMVEAFCDDEEAHLEASVNFILKNRLDDELRRHDWAGFARGYNGKGYRKNRYDEKLAEAFAKWKRIKDTPYTPGKPVTQAPVVMHPAPISTPEPVNGIAGILKYLLAAIATFFRSKPNAN
jgi:hypothetical protein